MNTNIDGLKAIYIALGGNSNTAAGFGSNAEALAAIAALLDGDTSGASTNGELLAIIANAANGLIKPTGTKTITANGNNIDVTQYAKVSVNVPQPTGKITITENGTDIDVSSYATADVNVSTTPANNSET